MLRHRTKILATVGPASGTPEAMAGLIAAGVDAVRINLGHGTRPDHTRYLAAVRTAAARAGRHVAVLADLQGPKIRTGLLQAPVQLAAGAPFTITVADCPLGDAGRVGCTWKGLAADLRPGDEVLIDDGRLRLRVGSLAGSEIRLVVERGGLLKSSKGINVPGRQLNAPALDAGDREDVAWALAEGIDMLAMSFVRDAADVAELRRLLAGRPIPVIAKLETPGAVERVDAIAVAAEGVMVARGDLGIEIGLDRLPAVQKELVQRANRHGRIVITATQMLESMIENPVPTRAECGDVANAVFEGADAVMLSGETAVGRHAQATVDMMAAICRAAEASTVHLAKVDLDRPDAPFPAEARGLSAAAEALATALGAYALVVDGGDPDLVRLASERRGCALVVARVDDAPAARRLALNWGVEAVVAPSVEVALEAATAAGAVPRGARAVVVSRDGVRIA